jgi:hypothetical protein
MTEKTYTFLEFAKLLNIKAHSIWHIIDVGDIRPNTIADHYHSKSLPEVIDSLCFSENDVEIFKEEFHRRRHEKFKNDYADVYESDHGPAARGLEFGPGWIGIAKEFCDQLRLWQADGWKVHLRWGKEKFGSLRLFTDISQFTTTPLQTYWLARVRERARRKSLRTCQECGQPGRLRWGGHVATLCDRHKHLVGEPRAEDGTIFDPDRQKLNSDGSVAEWPENFIGRYTWTDEELGLDEGLSMDHAKQMELEFKPFLSPDLVLDGTDQELADLRKKLIEIDHTIGRYHEIKFQLRQRGYEIAIQHPRSMATIDEIKRDAIIAEIELIMSGKQK